MIRCEPVRAGAAAGRARPRSRGPPPVPGRRHSCSRAARATRRTPSSPATCRRDRHACRRRQQRRAGERHPATEAAIRATPATSPPRRSPREERNHDGGHERVHLRRVLTNPGNRERPARRPRSRSGWRPPTETPRRSPAERRRPNRSSQLARRHRPKLLLYLTSRPERAVAGMRGSARSRSRFWSWL